MSLSTIRSYKGRTVDPNRRVEVYRNVNKRDGVWYSVRQDGKVIGHTKAIHLKECYFVVHEAGRQRVIKTGRKNVHAYVLGYVTQPRQSKYDLGPARAGMYKPYESGRFQVMADSGNWEPVICAMEASLGTAGLTIWMPRA